MKRTAMVVGGVVGVVFLGALAWKPPTSSSDVAGWVQAFGATVTIGLAVWLQYISKTESQNQAENIAFLMARQVASGVEYTYRLCQVSQWEDLPGANQRLREAMQLDVPIGDLPYNLINMVVRVRAIGAECLTVCELLDKGDRTERPLADLYILKERIEWQIESRGDTTYIRPKKLVVRTIRETGEGR